MRVGVIGAGAWGTAFANYLCELGNEVILWIREKELFEILGSRRENTYFLPGIKLSEKLSFCLDLETACEGRELIVFAIPVQAMRGVLENTVIDGEPILMNLSKGIEEKSLLFPSELIGSFFPSLEVVVLSGPSFAVEFANKHPTLLVAASHNEDVARYIRDSLSSSYLRIYSSSDVVGVELGGAVKNVIAIGSGMIDSLGLGENARAALITRGLVEIVRLGVAVGARLETLFGLAGVGDLVLTCTSSKSRNYRLGRFIGMKLSLDEALSKINGVPEGLWTVNAVVELAKNFNVEMPICQEIYLILNKGKSPEDSLKALMEREPKQEWRIITQILLRENL
ncbi:MAG: NAD(P)H-dependent glycerol-3-phosphate dehydrogenase [bacterium]